MSDAAVITVAVIAVSIAATICVVVSVAATAYTRWVYRVQIPAIRAHRFELPMPLAVHVGAWLAGAAEAPRLRRSR